MRSFILQELSFLKNKMITGLVFLAPWWWTIHVCQSLSPFFRSRQQNSEQVCQISLQVTIKMTEKIVWNRRRFNFIVRNILKACRFSLAVNILGRKTLYLRESKCIFSIIKIIETAQY